MKLRSIFSFALTCIAMCAMAQSVWVPGHYTKKGKFVKGHYQKASKPRIKYRTSTPKLKVAKAPRVKTGVIIEQAPDSRFMVGDRITSLKDASKVTYKMRTMADMRSFLASHSPTETVSVHIKRANTDRTIKVKEFGNTFHF